MKGLSSLRFDNRFTRELPADPETSNQTRQVLGACYSRVTPATVAAPELVAWSPQMMEQLGLAAGLLTDGASRCAFAKVFAGNQVLPEMDTHAMCYGGHQFGHWAGQLGDGRAINLGEAIDRDGTLQMLQLKGAGPTPYSRRADGLAVLRSSVREFLCSEAMHHLGVPTTRALSLVTTGEEVLRDMFYDGNAAAEPGAIVCRVAPSFLRFGSYEILAATGQNELLQQLADFTLRHHFAHLGAPTRDTYVAWFREVCERTATMILHWQRVGFVHGVMNTDNMSILGLTIDYGPYGWLEGYDPNWTPNTTDATHRLYRYGRQPQVADWNLMRLASALVPLVGEPAPLQEALDEHVAASDERWHRMMLGKLGLSTFEAPADRTFVEELVSVLTQTETDMTLFFRRLADLPLDGESTDLRSMRLGLADAWYVPDEITAAMHERTEAWLGRYRERLLDESLTDAVRRQRMNRLNPKYVLRNYMAHEVTERAAAGDPTGVRDLLQVLRDPYGEQPDQEDLAAKRPEWARHRPGCSTLSCSS